MGKKSTKNQKSSTKKGHKPNNQYKIDHDLSLIISKISLKHGDLFRVDFWDDSDVLNDYMLDMNRETLKGMADFIYKILGEEKSWTHTRPITGIDENGQPIMVDSWNNNR
jgi:hypothetical protein